MYEQRACFFAWLIMPFNSRSTTPLHRIISQWSWLFLLSHALFPFFFPPLIAKWIMDPTIFTRGRAASWRMGWPIMSIGGTHTEEGRLLLSKETSPFGLKKIQRLSVRWPNSRCHLCVFIFLFLVALTPLVSLHSLSNQNELIGVCGWALVPFMVSSGTVAAPLLPAWPSLSLSLLTVPG